MRGTTIQRFCARVKLPADPSSCWEWLGGKSHKYSWFFWNSQQRGAHRYAYEAFNGPIPSGLHIDHLCKNKGCVNPAHLEAVTNEENVKREPNYFSNRTHCPAGHPYSEENTYVNPRGFRFCRICQGEAKRRYAAKMVRHTVKRASGYRVADIQGCCTRGHPMDEQNTYVSPKGSKRCRACMKLGRPHA